MVYYLPKQILTQLFSVALACQQRESFKLQMNFNLYSKFHTTDLGTTKFFFLIKFHKQTDIRIFF